MVSDFKKIKNAHKGCKDAAEKKVSFFGEFCRTNRFFVSLLLSASVERCFVSRMLNFFGGNAKFTTIQTRRHAVTAPMMTAGLHVAD